MAVASKGHVGAEPRASRKTPAKTDPVEALPSPVGEASYPAMRNLKESCPDTALKVLKGTPQPDIDAFALRFRRSFADLLDPLTVVYGTRADFNAFLFELAEGLAQAWKARPAALKLRDLERDFEADWFLRENAVAYIFYIDRFAGNLLGVLEKLD